MKKINLEEILEFHLSLSSQTKPSKSFYIAAMRQACNQAIDLCAENAKLFWADLEQTYEEIDENSILKTKDQII